MKKEKIKAKVIELVSLFLVFSLVVLSGNLVAKEQKYGVAKKSAESSGKKIKISFKLSGGLGYLLNGAGDLNKARQGTEDALSYIEAEYNYYSTTFDWKRLSIHPDLRAGLIINFTPNIGIGISSGFITAPNEGKYSLNYNNSGSYWWGETYTNDEKVNVTRDYRLTAIPLNFDLYFFLPIGKSGKFNFFGHAGVGYYLGKLSHDFVSKGTGNYESFYDGSLSYQSESDYNSTTTESTKCNSMGFHGGLGLEMKMSSILSLGVELFGRYVDFKNWEGDASYFYDSKYRYWYSWSGWNESTYSNEDDEHGSLWTYDMHDDDSNRDYTFMGLKEEKPNGTYIKNARKASINLNTFGLSFSIRFHFDLF